MNNNMAKLELIRTEIEKSAEKEAAAIIEAAEKEAERTLGELEKKLQDEHNGNVLRITEDFRTAERKRVSEICFAENRRVLLYRNALTEEFFGKVEKKLIESLETPKYTAYLSDCIKKADEAFPLDGKATVFCRECDTNAVETALKGINCSLEADDNIKIGGIIVSYPETGVLIDLSLDAALENEREAFSSLKEMQL